MIKEIDHMVITTTNIKTCIDFYEKLGFSAKAHNNRYELFGGDFKINVHIKGSELSPHAQNIQIGSQDICFEISGNILKFKEELEQKGLTIIEGVVLRQGTRGEMQSIYLYDFDGNLVEFCSYE